MKTSSTNKLKIFNDPVYGFIHVPDESIFDLIETPYFQRLRNIKQLGMTHLVYPGALHTRFHHSMGAMYLATQAIEILRFKGHEVNEQDALSLIQAILLHDLGHGPFSHALENVLIADMNHEDLTGLFMQHLNKESAHSLKGALDIFHNTHPKKALHQLVAGQLDMDRLDYLNRDSFYTGVSEGVVSWDRIIKMLNISDDQLVIDEKGIYSIEKFIVARRLMYWQVYLHKTVISAEKLLNSIVRRAQYLAIAGEPLFASPALDRFLRKKYYRKDLLVDQSLLEDYALIDDHDLQAAIKVWVNHTDRVLSLLCSNLVNRHLFRIEIQKMPFTAEYLEEIRFRTRSLCGISEEDTEYFVISGITRNSAYDPVIGNIMVLSRDGTLTDIAQASDHLNISVLSQPVEKFFVCYPKKVAEPSMEKSRKT